MPEPWLSNLGPVKHMLPTPVPDEDRAVLRELRGTLKTLVAVASILPSNVRLDGVVFQGRVIRMEHVPFLIGDIDAALGEKAHGRD